MRFGLKSKDNEKLAGLCLMMLERRLVKIGLELPRLTPGYPHGLA